MKVLVVGGLTKDVIRRKGILRRPGGGAFYCSIAAARMGADVELWTVLGRDFPREDLLRIENEGIRVVPVKSTTSIGFVNEIDDSGHRRQWVSSIADGVIDRPLDRIDRFDYIQITPVLGEVGLGLISNMPSELTGIEVQGFVRRREVGPVKMILRPRMDELLRRRLLIHLSEEELFYFTSSSLSDEIRRYSTRAIALTRSAKGSFVFSNQSSYFIPAPRIALVEDVGCGDVYSTAMGLSLVQGRSLLDSAFRATAAATLLAESNHMERLRVGNDFEDRVSLVKQVYDEYGLMSSNRRHFGNPPT